MKELIEEHVTTKIRWLDHDFLYGNFDAGFDK
jgi:hypothetical protein